MKYHEINVEVSKIYETARGGGGGGIISQFRVEKPEGMT